MHSPLLSSLLVLLLLCTRQGLALPSPPLVSRGASQGDDAAGGLTLDGPQFNQCYAKESASLKYLYQCDEKDVGKYLGEEAIASMVPGNKASGYFFSDPEVQGAVQKLLDNDVTIHIVGDSVAFQLYVSMRCWVPGLKVSVYKARGEKSRIPEVYVDLLNGEIRIGNGSYFKTSISNNRTMFAENPGLIIPKPQDVVLLNAGLHFNNEDRKEFDSQLTLLRRLIKLTYPLVKPIWLGTTAQHFCTPDGNYRTSMKGMKGPQGAKQTRGGCCSLPKEVLTKNHFRQNMVLRKLIEPLRADGMNVPYLDMWEFTRDMQELHMGGGTRDCTHFCGNYEGPVYYMMRYLLKVAGDSVQVSSSSGDGAVGGSGSFGEMRAEEVVHRVREEETQSDADSSGNKIHRKKRLWG